MASTQQPWLHDRAVTVHGNGTVVCATSGAMEEGVDGWYVDDLRLLHRWGIEIATAEASEPAGSLSPIAWSAQGDVAEFIAAARHLGDAIPDPTVEVRQRRALGPMSFTETVRVVSRATAPVRGVLRITLGGDGLGIATVKAGRDGESPLVMTARSVAGLEWRTTRHHVSVSVRGGRCLTTAHGGVIEMDFGLAQGESAELTVTGTARRTHPSAFDAGPGSGVLALDRGVTHTLQTATDPRVERLLTTSLDDLRGLLLTDPEASDDCFVAAGTPWYLTLFGRDSLWSARLLLPLGTEPAGGTLRALARRQGTVVDEATAEQPGKIPHELRREVFVDPNTGMSLPTVYYGTIDATALWVCLLHDAWRAGMARADVEALLPSLRRAMTWLTEYSCPDGDGLLRYVDATGTGLANQGWKDSGDSMRTSSGAVAPAPIALVEAQAYAVEAARGAAALFEEFEVEGAGKARSWAATLSDRVRERFWVEGDDGPYLAMALDGNGDPVDGVGSNMGHCLGTGMLTEAEEERVVERLMRPDMLGPYGIGTLSTGNPAFNPLGYHTGSVWTHDTAICAWGMARAGYRTQARQVAQRLVDAAEVFDYRWPELYAGDAVLGKPATYPASCRPQGWSAASAVVVADLLRG